MSSIHKELTELAIKMGAPVVGHNVSEQIRAINVHLGGTSHGANISERIDELTKVWSAGGNSGISMGIILGHGTADSVIDKVIAEEE
jgi:hypothetical protein